MANDLPKLESNDNKSFKFFCQCGRTHEVKLEGEDYEIDTTEPETEKSLFDVAAGVKGKKVK